MSYKENDKAIWKPEVIKKKRQSLNLLRDDVAKTLDIKPGVYAYYESGTTVPSLIAAIKMSKYFGIPIDEMIDSAKVDVEDNRKDIAKRIQVLNKRIYHKDDITVYGVESEYPFNLIEAIYRKTPEETFGPYVTPEKRKEIVKAIKGLSKENKKVVMSVIDGPSYKDIPKEKLEEKLNLAVESLRPREQEIIKERYVEMKTLQEIGDKKGVTRERIRQIEASAIKKLRHPTRRVIWECW